MTRALHYVRASAFNVHICETIWGSVQGSRSRRSPRPYATRVHTIELTEEELRLVRAALHSYLEDFGHEEADVLRAIKLVLAKLPSAD